jgi:hypothetical protein
MELARKAAMMVATLAVALGVGYVMQNGFAPQNGRVANAEGMSQRALGENAASTPKDIVPLAAGLEISAAPMVLPALPETPALPSTAFAPPDARFVQPDQLPNAAPALAPSPEASDCPVSLDVIASAQATLDLTLIAPCHPSERVVLRHGGLAVTEVSSATGTLFASLPGMEETGDVSVLFSDGQEISAASALPDLPLYRRFAVQWMAEDAFQLNAFENGAGYGEKGHVSASNPQQRLANVPMRGGYLTTLGDASAPFPLLAEVYTFPLDKADSVDLTIEASITKTTCDRELLGEMLLSESGVVTKTDLSMATPTCDAIGDVLVLNNPLPDLKLAAAN